MDQKEIDGVSVVGEFGGAALGDIRLNRRLDRIAEAVMADPSAGFPSSMGTEADLEGFYRFVRHDRIEWQEVLKPHVDATLDRLAGRSEALVIHDSTEFRFGGDSPRRGLGKLGRSGQGFLGHFSLAVSADEQRSPLGVVAVKPWARVEPTPTQRLKQGRLTRQQLARQPSESDRWWEAIERVGQMTDTVTSVIHVMDSEADNYKVLCRLAQAERRFIVRLGQDRKLGDSVSGAEAGQRARQFAVSKPILCERMVHISRRSRYPGAKSARTRARDERHVKLRVRATPMAIGRPSYYGSDLPPQLALNAISVSEYDRPADTDPIEWVLLTTDPIDSIEQIEAIVDHYRSRWLVEEYFKALKTGCAFEKRQLESFDTLLIAMAIFIPVAWNLLRIRSVSRASPSAPATQVLTPPQIAILTRMRERPLPPSPTVRDALLSIARLGGHLRSNGDPGWMVLGRGYQKLLTLELGYRLRDTECDQS